MHYRQPAILSALLQLIVFETYLIEGKKENFKNCTHPQKTILKTRHLSSSANYWLHYFTLAKTSSITVTWTCFYYHYWPARNMFIKLIFKKPQIFKSTYLSFLSRYPWSTGRLLMTDSCLWHSGNTVEGKMVQKRTLFWKQKSHVRATAFQEVDKYIKLNWLLIEINKFGHFIFVIWNSLYF